MFRQILPRGYKNFMAKTNAFDNMPYTLVVIIFSLINAFREKQPKMPRKCWSLP